ncbi:hypothetical protein EDB92DRAFT_870998 [Lactarius akahatsu]|uniref:Uncharacterized protein n=1 Tax=Lactarius akahatsu TaxID=416441 RepID=A0AAD4QCL3_9AGAM|nr:hypothetical protein EDB92DRAFT_870998 [Lactarius akahatsu]
MCALPHLHRRHSVRGSLIHCHLIDRLCSGDEYLSSVFLLSLLHDDPVRDPVSMRRLQMLTSRRHGARSPLPWCDLILFLRPFPLLLFVCAPLCLARSRILDMEDQSSLGLYVIWEWGARASFIWRHLQSYDLVFPPVTVLLPRGRCFGSLMMFETQRYLLLSIERHMASRAHKPTPLACHPAGPPLALFNSLPSPSRFAAD